MYSIGLYFVFNVFKFLLLNGMDLFGVLVRENLLNVVMKSWC